MTSTQLYKLVLTTLLLFSLGVFGVRGQKEDSSSACKKILAAVSKKINSIQRVRYHCTRESVYSGENYHTIYSPEVYIDFTSNKNVAGYQFQAHDESYFSCYNGVQYFGLNKEKRTIDIEQKPKAGSFESLSPLYFSFISMRTMIPLLLNSKDILFHMNDTVFNNEKYYAISFELHNRYFGGLGKLESFTKDYTGNKTKPYVLIVNKKSILPYQFVAKFKDRPSDFIAVSFTNIDLSPKAPEVNSWFYSTYTNEYRPPAPAKPMIAVGAVPDNWVLPFYDPKRIDSVSLYQYRGKIVMLDFWIKSCGPCMASFPHLKELQQKFGPDKFQLLSINTEDGIDDISFFFKKHSPNYKMLFGGDKLVEAYGIPAFPSIIILDQSGKIIYSGRNGFDQHAIEEVIKKYSL